MFLEQIRKNTINHGYLSFGKKKGMLVERYFDLSKNGFSRRDEIYLYLEKFHFEIENQIIVMIYLDVTKNASPQEKLEFIHETSCTLLKYDKKSDNNQKILIQPKIDEKELWKIKIEIEKCDEVKFYATWK